MLIVCQQLPILLDGTIIAKFIVININKIVICVFLPLNEEFIQTHGKAIYTENRSKNL